MREAEYQADLIKRIKKRLPGCLVLKNDPNYIQGIPDLIVLNGPRWGALEVKRSSKAARRPNQEWYVRVMSAMSYAAFISPDTEEEVLDDLQRSLEASW